MTVDEIFYYIEQMVKQSALLGPLEQIVLLAVYRLGSDAYGMTVRREIEERIGRNISIGAVYATLDRLQAKGFVSSYVGESTPERGGRAKRHFRMKAAGRRALEQSQEAVRRMAEGLDIRPEST